MGRRDLAAEGERLSLWYLLHMWVPVWTVPAMAAGLAPSLAGARFDPEGALSLSLGVFVAYTGDRVLEHGPGWSVRARYGLWGATGAAGVVLGLLTLRQPQHWPAVLALGAVCIAYLWLKSVWLMKTLLVAAAWLCGALMLAMTPAATAPALLAEPGVWAFGCAVAAGAVLCDLKDVRRDTAAGVRSLPVRLGEVGACRVARALAAAGVVLASLGSSLPMLACGLAMLGVSWFPGLLRQPVLGALTVDALLLAPVALLPVVP